jgi:hypothetical protein
LLNRGRTEKENKSSALAIRLFHIGSLNGSQATTITLIETPVVFKTMTKLPSQHAV